MASISQLHPLEINERTGEPFLRLPSPHENIIITPPRLEDVPAIVRALNDPRVYSTLAGPPFPYKEEHAIWWINYTKTPSDELLQELRQANDKDLKIVDGCPVRTLREVQSDGSDVFLGDVGCDRCGYPDVVDPEEKSRLTFTNDQLPPGDKDIVWCIGDYLVASHHGKGIMSAAVSTLVSSWMVPRMNAQQIRVETFLSNRGSRRVFEKNGFVVEETVELKKVIPCGKIIEGFDILWWRSSEKKA
ncbi:hypothetical protein BDY19DRAFT_911655 [Irpex rosettiformis]|uniref:Uncharacterized protein n=1 Tax=Irpex rosettiformis TaxID=378272 RepID=A0ACB8UIQ1_9APHY|nr:hypothetical protein BDY19DRAFT_911655 [Irpex rosettiformis]